MAKVLTDENIFPSTLSLLRSYSHDVKDIKEWGCDGISDREVIELAKREDRFLLTMDMHFANVFLFPPSESDGIIIIRVKPAVPNKVDNALRTFLEIWNPEKTKNSLIIVEKDKIRTKK